MKRVLHSLAAQLLALLLVALVLAHLLAAVVMSWDDHVQVHPLAVRAIGTQVAAAYRLAQADAPTADLLTQRLDVHEKNAWMLRSLLQ